MTKIGFDAERLKSQQSGLGKFCTYLGKALLEEHAVDVQFFQKKKTEKLFGKDAVYANVNSFNKIIGVNAKVDLWHCTQQLSNYFPIDKRIPIVSTIHDLNFLYTTADEFKKKRKLKKVQRLINRSEGIVFISHFTESEVRKHLDLHGKHTEVIYNAPALPTIATETIEREEKPYFFTIGLISEKKNFHSLLPLLNHFPEHKLLIAGNKSGAYASKILQEAQNLGVAERLVLTGEISETEKLSYYKGCEAFLMPSLAEGFCLPVVEAMHVGKPVFLSSIGALQEIGSSHAYYFESFDAIHMANVVENGLTDFNQNRSSRELALKKHASQFTWEKAAKQYIALYKKVLSSTK